MSHREEEQGLTPVELRKAQKLTQLQVAHALGIRPETVSDWERGKYAPSVLFVGPLAKLYGCTADELVHAFENLHQSGGHATNGNN